MTDLQNASPDVTPTGPVGTEERPRTVAEAAGLLRRTAGTVLVRGGATKLDWAGRVDQPDLILDTAELRGVLTHNPADMTASVRAGTTLEELQRQLAGDGQWLALDPPTSSTGATVGGLLAAGDSGPSRLRYGGLRDLVIGVTLVLADGTVARSGGHVIKNVAGYDLAKIVNGSLGSLALIAEVVVRLHPRPEASLTIAGPATAAQATAAALALAASPHEPAAVEWVSNPGASGRTGQLLVRVDGTSAFVDGAGGRVRDLLAGLDVHASALSPVESTQVWQAQAGAVRGLEGETSLRICGLPGDFARLAERGIQLATDSGLDLQLVSSTALGIHTVRLGGGATSAHAAAVTALRAEAVSQGATVLLRSRPPELDRLVDALGPPPSSVELLRRVKDQFDPAGRWAPGRFRAWY